MKAIHCILLLSITLGITSCGMSYRNFNKQKHTKLKKIESTEEGLVEDEIVENENYVFESNEPTIESPDEVIGVESLEVKEKELLPEEDETISEATDVFIETNTERTFPSTEIKEDSAEEIEVNAEDLDGLDATLNNALIAFGIALLALAAQAIFFISWIRPVGTGNQAIYGDMIAGFASTAAFIACIALCMKYNRQRKRLGIKRKDSRYYLLVISIVCIVLFFPNVVVCIALTGFW